MNSREREALDRHITGNYGEDQFKGEDGSDVIDKAGNSVAYELHLFAHTIAEQDREDFFHPMNRDEWVARFCEWLAAKQAKSAEIRASND